MAKPTKKPGPAKRSAKKSLNASTMKRIKGGDDESPKESISFGFKAPQVKYTQQLPGGLT